MPLLNSHTNSKIQNTCINRYTFLPFFGAAMVQPHAICLGAPLRHFVLAFSEGRARQGGYGGIVSRMGISCIAR